MPARTADGNWGNDQTVTRAYLTCITLSYLHILRLLEEGARPGESNKKECGSRALGRLGCQRRRLEAVLSPIAPFVCTLYECRAPLLAEIG